jgi:GntR family transcriptional repressor for pyruvate dehydrogenase complex
MARDTLADRVAQDLFSAVVDGSFPTGYQLPSEGQIASSFGVSRAVVREALGHLKAIGVVQVTNGKRAVVKLLDSVPLAQFFSLAAVQGPNNLTSLLEVRCGIESETAFLAAQRRTDEDLEVLQRLTQEMGSLARSKAHFDPGQYAELDRAFHLEVARASKNLLLEQLALSIREPMKESILAGLRTQSSPRQRRSLQAGHDKIADAIKRGDSEKAQLAMRSHMIGAASRLILAETAATGSTGPVRHAQERAPPCP